jgi:uncharacterized protein
MADVKAFQEDVKKGDLTAVRAALAADPELLEAANEAGQSAFVLAKYYRQDTVAEYLLSLHPLLASHSADGWTPLHLAAFFGYTELANALLDRGAQVDIRSSNAMKNTPLHAACAGGQLALVDLLLKRGADPNATQEGGWTALHGAAQAGQREMVEALLANGADVNLRAGNQQSALDLALIKGHQEVASILEALGSGGR